jgi:hypothetical protein
MYNNPFHRLLTRFFCPRKYSNSLTSTSVYIYSEFGYAPHLCSVFRQLNHAKQITIRVFKYDIISVRRIPPRVIPCPKRQQPFDLTFLVAGIEINVHPTPSPLPSLSSLQGHIRSFAFWVTQHNPILFRRLSWNVLQCRLTIGRMKFGSPMHTT